MFPDNLLVGRNRAIDRERLYEIRPPVRVSNLMKKFSAFITIYNVFLQEFLVLSLLLKKCGQVASLLLHHLNGCL
jgi:hypothetical protein